MSDHNPQSSPISRLINALDVTALVAASLCVIAFSAIVIYVAIARYVFSSIPSWSEEVPRSLLVWAIFIGLIPATKRSMHLNAGLLPLLVQNDRIRRQLERVAKLITALFLIVLAVTGWELTEAGRDSLTTALQIPNAVVYVALPIGAGVAALVVLLQLIEERLS